MDTMVIALILSGGTGSRVGTDIPKQYISVDNKPLIMYSMEVLLKHPQIDAVQVVADEAWHETLIAEIDAIDSEEKFRGFSQPGDNRQLSIYNGLCDIRKYASDDDIMFIHDAARPNITSNMIDSYIEAMAGFDGLMPVLPMKDTVYLSINGDKVDELLNREQVVAGQAPELFLLGKYYNANKALLPDKICKIKGSTEPAVLAGMNIAIVPGDENNFKITTMADLDRFRNIISEK